jgi:hypothetical protein
VLGLRLPGRWPLSLALSFASLNLSAPLTANPDMQMRGYLRPCCDHVGADQNLTRLYSLDSQIAALQYLSCASQQALYYRHNRTAEPGFEGFKMLSDGSSVVASAEKRPLIIWRIFLPITLLTLAVGLSAAWAALLGYGVFALVEEVL